MKPKSFVVVSGKERPLTTQRYQVLLEWDSEAEAWVTYVPTLNGLSTFGQTREEALSNTQEAILGYLEAAQEVSLPSEAEWEKAARGTDGRTFPRGSNCR